jgi:hypothetical protein
MIVSNCLLMHARQIILTNGSFKDGIEIEMKWVVTGAIQIIHDTLKKGERQSVTNFFFVFKNTA